MYKICFNNYINNEFVETNNLPLIFLGFNIKYSSDEILKIPQKYNPFKLMHYSRECADVYQNFYYYGIEIYNKNESISQLINKLNKITYNDDIITLETYKNLLKQYKLSCNDCYLTYKIGCFPLDLLNLYKFIDKNIAYEMIEDFLGIDKQNQVINNMAGLHLQILTQHPKFNSYNCEILPNTKKDLL